MTSSSKSAANPAQTLPDKALLDKAFQQGAMLVARGHLMAAETVYAHAIALAPASRDAWYRRGIVRALLGAVEASARDLDAALALDHATSATAAKRPARSRWAPALT